MKIPMREVPPLCTKELPLTTAGAVAIKVISPWLDTMLSLSAFGGAQRHTQLNPSKIIQLHESRFSVVEPYFKPKCISIKCFLWLRSVFFLDFNFVVAECDSSVTVTTLGKRPGSAPKICLVRTNL